MRPVNARYAYSLILGGSLAISGLAAYTAFMPVSEASRLIAFALIALAGLMIVMGLYWYRVESVAWKALADHLGQELLNLEAINTTNTDDYCAFNRDDVVTISPGFAGLLGCGPVNTPDDIATGLKNGQDVRLKEALADLIDSGDTFQINVNNAEREYLLSGQRARVRPGQKDLFVVRIREVTGEKDAIRRERERTSFVLQQMVALQARLEALPIPVWTRAEDLSVLWMNRAAAELLEIPAAEAIALQREIFANQFGEDGRWLAEQAQLDGQARLEQAHAVVQGNRHLFEVTELPLHQPGAAYMGYAIDLTRMEEKELELRRHIAGNAAVLERLGAAIAIYGPDQRLTFHNQAMVDLWGLDEAMLRNGPTYSEVLEELRTNRRLPEQADFRRFRADQQALFTSLIEPSEELMHLPDGRILRALVAPHPFGGLMFVYEDVSRRFELETSLNTMVAVQQETFNNLAEGIAVFAPDGRLKLFNPAYSRIWNVPIEQLQGEPHATEVIGMLRPFFNVPDSEWPAMHEEIVAVSLDRGGRNGRLMRADGSVLDYAGIPLPDGSVLHTFVDITDSVRIEQALRDSNDALEAADRLKSEFIANITYQLRTPLTAIMGFAEMLNNQYFGTINERQQEYTGGIIEAGQRLLTLINDILELASIEAGTLKLERSEVDVKEMIESVAALAGDWARQEELDMSVEIGQNIGTIWLDERRIRQALFNLLSNAIKFTPSGGHVDLSAEVRNGALWLQVSDNGIGIAPADQARIFKRFERANIRTGQAGAGLGLSVVKSIIEMHGGKVEVESAPNRGSRVRCVIPLLPADTMLLADTRNLPLPIE